MGGRERPTYAAGSRLILAAVPIADRSADRRVQRTPREATMRPYKLDYAHPDTGAPNAIHPSAAIAVALLAMPLAWLIVLCLWRG